MIKLRTLNLKLIDYKNKEHLRYLKYLMKSKDMGYLWDLSNGNLSVNQNEHRYIVENQFDEKIGYLNISSKTEAYHGDTVRLYYAIDESYRGQSLGKKLVEEVMNWLFEQRNIDCVVAQVDHNNNYSKNVLNKAGMVEVQQDDEYSIFMKTSRKM